ncbi:4a-hydroxytetrahydrobiopterin dehydratase [Polynucleobacter sp. Ross1-W9]|uniref:4a-hydroxytetrahydrobiopterin dehydratase n=1 Tax=Polynucleobacter parvulilacunae TaxID=1855631 RepID=UPI001C0DDEA8|nr:4a-hydroxytetrahydrobiopterin dehydratase [Polynucleobacter parvulilacunae]MBU3556916.1 4a-hydroxytetrahydrobiopterin dehydratase [Polynucleobacter parvulilacunae]
MIVDGFDLDKEIPLWALSSKGKSIMQTFTFADFKQAFEFMTLCAQYAEEIDHHPDWSNSWNKVVVELSTHSAGGLTKLDIQLAKAMDAFASQVKQN